jgi:hypothetical protein
VSGLNGFDAQMLVKSPPTAIRGQGTFYNDFVMDPPIGASRGGRLRNQKQFPSRLAASQFIM